jgi:hypothetical protein
MTYDFFADVADKIEILNFILNETDLQIFDKDSVFGQEINMYRNVDEITSKFDLKNGGGFAITFQLWSPRFKAAPAFNKVELNPKYCKGHTFRYATEGWGLIQLYFGGLSQAGYSGLTQTTLHKSHIGHFSKKGARGWEDINVTNGKASQWDWKEIEKSSRQLKYYIDKKLAVKRIGTFGILRGAELLEKEGIALNIITIP